MTAPVTVAVPVNRRTLTLNTTHGVEGDVITATGTGFRPNVDVQLGGWGYDMVIDNVLVRSGANGDISGRYTITGYEDTILAYEFYDDPATTVRVPFTIGGPEKFAEQRITGSILPGSLAMSQAGSGIDLGSVTTSGSDQTITGALNQVTVVDTRTGSLGWALTATATDLVDGAAEIQAEDMSWTPACAAGEGSPSTVVTGSAGPLGPTAATLCSQTAAEGTTDGLFTADAALAVEIPAFATPGTYTGTITLSLS